MYALSSQPINFIDPAEERELVFASQHGNITSRNKLLVSLLPMIIRLVEQMVGAGHPHFEDYVQEGVLGNIIGIGKFDLNKFSNRYYSYGFWWIRHCIDDERGRDCLWSSSTADFTHECFPAEDETCLPNRVDFPEKPLDSSSFNTYIERNIDSIRPVIASQADIFDQFRVGGLACDYDLLDEMMNLSNGGLTPKQREILRLYYHEGLTFREVSKKVGFSQRWVMELRNKALTRLKKQVEILSG